MRTQSRLSLVAVTLLLSFCGNAHADWDVAVGYADFSYPSTVLNEYDFSLQAASISAAYQFSSKSSFSYKPELQIGFGINEDVINFTCNGDIVCSDEVKIDYFLAASIRGTYHATNLVYIFIQPSYIQIKTQHPSFTDNTNSSREMINLLDDSFQLGLGAGIGFKPISSIGLELNYKKLDDVSVLTGSLHYSF